MALTVATFRAAFPAYTQATHADARVQFWLDMAVKLMKAERWGDLFDNGQGLFVAHHLTLERQASATSGGNEGAPGLVSGKTVGSVSKSYSQQDVTFARAGNYNLTVHGREYFQLARMIGAGGCMA
jgi:hypothetical protein